MNLIRMFFPSLVQHGAVVDQVFLQDGAAEAPHPHRRGRPRRRRQVTPGYVASCVAEVLKTTVFYSRDSILSVSATVLLSINVNATRMGIRV